MLYTLMIIKQTFIKAKGKDPTIKAYMAEIILPITFIILSFITEDMSIEITTRIDPMYPNISIKIELFIIFNIILSILKESNWYF